MSTLKNPAFFDIGDKIINYYSRAPYIVIEADKRGMAKLKNLNTKVVEDWNADNNRQFTLLEKENNAEQLLLF